MKHPALLSTLITGGETQRNPDPIGLVIILTRAASIETDRPMLLCKIGSLRQQGRG